MLFSAIQGHGQTKNHLMHMVKHNQVVHAQLFFGPEGSPNLTLALALATYIHCQNKSVNDACGQCAACVKMEKLIHPDVHFVFPISTTQQITGKAAVSTHFLKPWRAFLHAQPYGNAADWHEYMHVENKQLIIPKEEARQVINHLSLKPFESQYKIMLIWLPEYLHATAANALLKILEEPPAHTLFLLVSGNVEKILKTMVSSTQQIAVRAFTDQDIAHMLAKQYRGNEHNFAQIVTLAQGNFNKALKLIDVTADDHFEKFQAWMRHCYTGNFSQLTLLAEAFQKMHREAQKNFIMYGLCMLREILIVFFAQKSLVSLTAVERAFVEKLSQTLTFEKVKNLVKWFDQAYDYITRNANAKMLHCTLSIKIVCLFSRDS